MYSVYAISSVEKNYIYVGMSCEVEKRIAVHNSGNNKTIAPYAPYDVLMVEKVGIERQAARIREKYWKSGTGKRQLRNLRDKKF
ncbi:GIY-YIG nuclease family protein [Nonlabens ponticola]|uniref:GIY-YIG nuclease family protein n=1 Tax=Nonlabens ponticola TaxID=2496866 RepID=A0A3S9N144_9FLAO|nr:GIY-YIG nuclease family protein [Nonlabens ponticola]